MRNADQLTAQKAAWRKANLAHWNETGKAWKKAHPKSMRVFKFRRYGLTIEKYEAMLKEQGGGCAICKAPTPRRKNIGDFCVDHDHATAATRGLLCQKCNAGLGNFDENPKLFFAAVDYLVKHGSPGIFAEAAG